MSSRPARGRLRRLAAAIRRPPADLVAVTAVAVAALGLATVPEGEPIAAPVVEFLVGTLLVAFLPGYVVLAALFPGSQFEGDAGRGLLPTRGLDLRERLPLAFGVSVALAPIVGTAFALTIGFDPGVAVPTVAGAVLVVVVPAAVRRKALPREERFAVPWRTWIAELRSSVVDADSRIEAGTNVALVAGVVLATSTLAFGLAAPQQGGSSTGMYLLTENESGDLVASGYPSEFAAGEGRELTVSLRSHEASPTNYTVVVEVIGPDGGDTELRRLSTSLASGEAANMTHTVAPGEPGDRQRLAYYLYRGDAPADASRDTAYRYAHIWINVTA